MAGRSASPSLMGFDLQWVLSYCAAHPTNNLVQAGTMLRLDVIRRETGH
jgi:hypothetical protein